jgi:hypothetical protein
VEGIRRGEDGGVEDGTVAEAVRRREGDLASSKVAQVARLVMGATLVMARSVLMMCSEMEFSVLGLGAPIMPGVHIGSSKGTTEATIGVSEVIISIEDRPILMFVGIICLEMALISVGSMMPRSI